MARHLALQPFRAIRYAPHRVSDLGAVTSPPYDVLDQDTAAALRRSEPHNVVRLTLDPDGPEAAARQLKGWRTSGVLLTEPQPAIYGYELRIDDRVVQRGLIGTLELREPEERIVLPHENVMPGPVAGRLALLRATDANLEPLLLTYDGRGGAIRELLDEPGEELIHATTTGPPCTGDRPVGRCDHRIWRIDDPTMLASISADLAERRALIADGHHRYSAARALQAERGRGGPWDTVLVLLVDHDRYPPHVGAIHRVVDRLSLDTLLDAIGDFAPIPDDASAEPEDAVLVTDGRRWVRLDLPATDGLLVHTVDELLLGTRMEVSEEDVRYVHDRQTAVRMADRGAGAAFLLPPVQASDVFRLAEQGRMMPRKSTSFGPKPRTGFVMRAFDS